MNRLLLRLGRTLRYRSLPALIGQRIAVRSLTDLEAALRALAGDLLPPDTIWKRNEHIEGAIAKYGLIDTELAAPRSLFDDPTTLSGIPVLRHTGFLPPRGSRWPDGTDDDLSELGIDTLLQDFATDFDPDRAVLKLFLQDDIPQEQHGKWLMDTVHAKRPLVVPPDYFPRSFTVEDACVTNASFIWFARHFYM